VTFHRFHIRAACVALVCCIDFAAARSQGQRPLSVSFTPSTLHPGDVARVDISGIEPGEQMTATLLGQDLLFHYNEREHQWHALVGIDLDTKPGAYQLRVKHGGTAAGTTSTVRIEPKQFRVRRLTVSAEFVDPPSEALEQIAQDTAMLAAAYARTSPRKWTAPFVLPVDGAPTSNFGTRSYYNGERRAPHAGVDFVGKPGTPVRAANRGEVVVSTPMYFTGNTIVVDYGDRLFSVFAHLSELRAKTGDIVEPDTIVGLVGATGRVTGPHLHWSVRLNGARVDPLSLIAATAR
jgi:murein DD-endopeptidase MepM/ murein hydrolase activator NlpD